eukprot:s810_g31.t1
MAWKDVFEAEMFDHCPLVGLVAQLFAQTDILDAFAFLQSLQANMTSYKNQAVAAKGLQKGRKRKTDEAENVDRLKKTLKKQREEGNEQAGRALEKLVEVQQVPSIKDGEDGKGAASKKSQKKTKTKTKSRKPKKPRRDPYKRQAGDQILLIKKRQIVRWALENEALVVGSLEKALQEQFPEYSSRRYSHWRNQYFLHRWEDVPDPVLAKCTQLPNKYRVRGGTAKGPKRSKFRMHPQLEEKMQEQIDCLTTGEHACMPRAEHVTKTDVRSSLEWMFSKINKEVDVQQRDVQDKNQRLLSQFQQGTISAQELANSFEQVPERLISKDMSRERFAKIVSEQNIAEQLILNYDQTWILAYRSPKTTLRKKRPKRGQNLTRVMNVIGSVEHCLHNWQKMPRALFAKAWITTGHISKERSMEISGLSEDELDNVHLISDPLSLSGILGEGNEEGPSIDELILGGQSKRHRVVWSMSGRVEGIRAMVPGVLIPLLEKYLSSYLYSCIAPGETQHQSKEKVSLVLSRRSGKEASACIKQKHLDTDSNGLKVLKSGAPTRTAKELAILMCTIDGAIDLCFMVFDRENLTLSFPEEEQPRALQCYLLEPGEGQNADAMTPQELKDIFGDWKQAKPEADESGEEQEPDCDEENPALMEAQNLIPPVANDAGDGLVDVSGGEVVVEQNDLPCHLIREGKLGEFIEHSPPDEEGFTVDEELVPTPKIAQPADDEGPFLSSAPSSSSKGLNVTPDSARCMLPVRTGVKIQHRTCKNGSSSCGWQAWIEPTMPSRWFSYGPPAGRYTDRNAALNAAVQWLWEMDKSF